MPVPFHPAVPIVFQPNHFFVCPNCGKRIEVIIDFEKLDQRPNAEIFLKCLPPGGCGWCGDLPMFKGAPIPEIPNYFFICPNCGKPIEVIIYLEKVDQKPDGETFLKCLPPGGCKWSGELPMSMGRPMPRIQRTTS
jgi:predicted nucleic acid-binding Zn ribbon protein